MFIVYFYCFSLNSVFGQQNFLLLIGKATINFTSTLYLVNEDLGSLNICLHIIDLPAGGLGCNVTVQLILLNGTACMLA